MIFSLSAGQRADAPEGRSLLERQGDAIPAEARHMIMDRAYEGDAMRQSVRDQGLEPVVPPKKTRLKPWEYDTELYKRRNEVERAFCRIKRFRRVFTRYEKLDLMYLAFVTFAFSVDMLFCVNRP